MTSRTRKIAWWPHVFKLDFYVFSRIMSISGKFKEILSASFYFIIPPQGISSTKHNFFIKRFQTFSRLALMQSTQFFSCSLNLQDSCYWWKFFPYLQPVSWKVRNCLFPISLLNIETRPNYAWKNWVKRVKTTQQKSLQWCIFYSNVKEPDQMVKMWQNLLSLFLLPFVM